MKPFTLTITASAFVMFLSTALSNARAQQASFIDQPRPLVMASLQSGARASEIAGMGISIQNLNRLPDGRRVRLFGSVERVGGNHSFVLRDETGTVSITSFSPLPTDLEQGREVTVAGRVNDGIFGRAITARSVAVMNETSLTKNDQPKPPLPQPQPAVVSHVQKPRMLIVVENASGAGDR